MSALVLALLLAGTSGDPVAAATAKWRAAVQAVRSDAPSPRASIAEKMRHLIRLDEVTRQNLWIMDDPALTPDQQRSAGMIIGLEMRAIDGHTTRTLKALLPRSGWFDNHVDGRFVTHGAWLIAQHSPDPAFRRQALALMARRLATGGVDARDYALSFDRVRRDEGKPQRFGSQFTCRDGHLALEPLEDESRVDAFRERIGWSQTLAETLGDHEVGKPCVQ